MVWKNSSIKRIRIEKGVVGNAAPFLDENKFSKNYPSFIPGVREYWVIDSEKKLLLTYDFSEEGMPCIYPLEGEVGLAIYEEKLKINLTKMSEIVEKYHRD